MKRLTKITVLSISLAMMFASCTKEGPAGADGQDGANGTVECVKCHDNSQQIFEKSNQWASSGHAVNGNFERNGTDCAPCHTSQGFLEVLETGAQTCANDISNPNPPNCYTCHQIHSSYTEDDWNLTTTDPVKFWLNDVESDQGTANVCINCHQARVVDPFPDVNGTGTYTITSSRFGPHHGPQGILFAGTGGFEIGTGYTNSFHTDMIDNSCVSCHMQEAYGTQAGGHQMGMTYDYHGSQKISTTSCIKCHTDESALSLKIENSQNEIADLLDSLGTILIANGMLTSSGSVVTGDYTNIEAGIIYNYQYINEDRSLGIHNFNYAKTLLSNSITAAK